jgi:hypothetical protein
VCRDCARLDAWDELEEEASQDATAVEIRDTGAARRLRLSSAAWCTRARSAQREADAMADGEYVRVETAELRRILHRYNNMTARIMTRAEVALLDGEADEYVAALESIVQAAADIAEFTKETRAALLGRDD